MEREKLEKLHLERIRTLELEQKNIKDKRLKELIRFEIIRERIKLCSLQPPAEYNGHEIEDENSKCLICGITFQDEIDLLEESNKEKYYLEYNGIVT